MQNETSKWFCRKERGSCCGQKNAIVPFDRPFLSLPSKMCFPVTAAIFHRRRLRNLSPVVRYQKAHTHAARQILFARPIPSPYGFPVTQTPVI